MSAIEQAERVATAYADREAKKAILRAEKHRAEEQGRCGCRSCLHTDTAEANLWLDRLDPDFKLGRYVVEGNKVFIRNVR